MNNVDLSELATAAVTMNELFREFLNAGFTDPQALRLTAYLAMGHPPQTGA